MKDVTQLLSMWGQQEQFLHGPSEGGCYEGGGRHFDTVKLLPEKRKGDADFGHE